MGVVARFLCTTHSCYVAVFAQQGYFVIGINPTGSSSFGQAFVDAITKDWGGKPFVDMQKGFQHVLKTYPEIDRCKIWPITSPHIVQQLGKRLDQLALRTHLVRKVDRTLPPAIYR